MISPQLRPSHPKYRTQHNVPLLSITIQMRACRRLGSDMLGRRHRLTSGCISDEIYAATVGEGRSGMEVLTSKQVHNVYFRTMSQLQTISNSNALITFIVLVQRGEILVDLGRSWNTNFSLCACRANFICRAKFLEWRLREAARRIHVWQCFRPVG
jgi:hypothetical protein